MYGPRQPSTGSYAIVTGALAQHQLEGSLLTVESDGSHYRDFVHVHDVVRGLVVGMQINVSGDSISLGTVWRNNASQGASRYGISKPKSGGGMPV